MRSIVAISFSILFFIAWQLYCAICAFVIAKKAAISKPWLALVPPLNLLVISKVAEFPAWTGLLVFVPYVGKVVACVLAAGVALRLGRPFWTGLLQVSPFSAWVLPAFYARSKPAPRPPTPAFCIRCGKPRKPGRASCAECGLALPDAVGGQALPRALQRAISLLPAAIQMPAAFSLLAAAASVFVVGFLIWDSGRIHTPDSQIGASLYKTFQQYPFEGLGPNVHRPSRINCFFLPDSPPSVELLHEIFPPGVDTSKVKHLGVFLTASRFIFEDTGAILKIVDAGNAANQRAILAAFQGTPAAKILPLTQEQLHNSQFSGLSVAFTQQPVLLYAMVPKNSTLVIMVSCAPEHKPLAERLIRHLGHEDGLFAYPMVRQTVPRLPITVDGFNPPLSLENLTIIIRQHESHYQRMDALDRFLTEDAQEWLVYRSGGKRWGAQINYFGQSYKGELLWRTLRWFIKLYTQDDDLARILLDPESDSKWSLYRLMGLTFRPCKGGYVVFSGPAGSEAGTLLRLLTAD